MRRFILVSLAAAMVLLAVPPPKVQAIDPVTIAILAPIALKAAQIAKPYVIRGLMNLGSHMLSMGGNLLYILLLPWGFIEVTLGLPFGGLAPGIRHIVLGFFNMGKLVFNAVLLPVAAFGMGSK
ncbi:MAG: hypothetical protein J6R85_03090 [Lentisphaeria bacterium]|nr:hypothetical protein [Lentisphaeria bacterium]